MHSLFLPCKKIPFTSNALLVFTLQENSIHKQYTLCFCLARKFHSQAMQCTFQETLIIVLQKYSFEVKHGSSEFHKVNHTMIYHKPKTLVEPLDDVELLLSTSHLSAHEGQIEQGHRRFNYYGLFHLSTSVQKVNRSIKQRMPFQVQPSKVHFLFENLNILMCTRYRRTRIPNHRLGDHFQRMRRKKVSCYGNMYGYVTHFLCCERRRQKLWTQKDRNCGR